jgi:uncharacterized small protein (DUF1192 family)
MKAYPSFVPTVFQLYHASDLITVDLVQRKITWGEANKSRMVLFDEYKVKYQAFSAQLKQELNTSHQTELAQRQAASQAELAQQEAASQDFWEQIGRVSKALGAAAYAIAPNSPGGRMGAASAGIPLP